MLLVVKDEGNNPRGISSRRCEDNNKLTLEYFGEVRRGLELSGLEQGEVPGCCEYRAK
jgi:hypothetical protein